MDDQDIILIEAYLAGELKGEALTSFQKRIQEEAALASEVAIHQEMEFMWKVSDKVERTAEWKAFLEGNPADKSAFSNTKPLYLVTGIAAVCMLLFGMYWWLLGPTPASHLADQYWHQTEAFTYQNLERSATLSDLDSQVLREASEKMIDKDYQGSLETLATLSTVSSEQLLLTGVCYYYLENFPKSQEAFQKIIDDPVITDKAEASWYLALLLLKQEKIPAAKTLLSQIIDKQSWNYALAKELLEEL